MFLCLSIPTTFAFKYWNGDKNCPIIWSRFGVDIYLDKSSIKVELNDPPFYIIYAKFTRGGLRFFYDEKEKDMRYASGVNKWEYVRPHGVSSTHTRFLYMGEAIFYLALRKKFYGSYLVKELLLYDQTLEMDEEENYFPMFSDSFYEYLDGKSESGDDS